MKVTILDRQDATEVNRLRLGRIVRLVMGFVPPPPPAAGWDSVTLILTDDALIQEVNRGFLGHDAPTDVISFSYPALPGADAAATGEVFVNVQQALRLGPRFGGASRELALYAAHGCDHLSGADDGTPSERRRMRSRECRWLRRPDILALRRHLLSETRSA